MHPLHPIKTISYADEHIDTVAKRVFDLFIKYNNIETSIPYYQFNYKTKPFRGSTFVGETMQSKSTDEVEYTYFYFSIPPYEEKEKTITTTRKHKYKEFILDI